MRLYHAMSVTALLGLVIGMSGCSKNERLAEMAEEHTRQQAAQNQQMAQLQQEIAQGATELIEANDRAREEVVAIQRDIQTERTAVGQQRDLLEEDRRRLAEQRRQDPIIAAAITQFGMVVACVLPLVVCWYLLHREPTQSDDATVTEVLIEDLIVERPLLLSAPSERRAAIACEDPPNAHESCDADQPVG